MLVSPRTWFYAESYFPFLSPFSTVTFSLGSFTLCSFLNFVHSFLSFIFAAILYIKLGLWCFPSFWSLYNFTFYCDGFCYGFFYIIFLFDIDDLFIIIIALCNLGGIFGFFIYISLWVLKKYIKCTSGKRCQKRAETLQNNKDTCLKSYVRRPLSDRKSCKQHLIAHLQCRFLRFRIDFLCFVLCGWISRNIL